MPKGEKLMKSSGREYSQTSHLQNHLKRSQEFLAVPAQTFFYQLPSENADAAEG